MALGTPVTADNYAVASVTNDAPTVFPKGATTITWTVKGAAGNTATGLQTVTVNDTEKPVLTVPAALVSSAPAAQYDVAISFAPTDNCAGATVVASLASCSTLPVGTTTVNVTATDASGNTRQSGFTVTLNDVTPPAVATQNVSVALVNGQAVITADQMNNGSPDACGIASTGLSRTAFNCADSANGPITVTLQ